MAMAAADRCWYVLGELAAEGVARVMCGGALLLSPVAQVVGVAATTGHPVYASRSNRAELVADDE